MKSVWTFLLALAFRFLLRRLEDTSAVVNFDSLNYKSSVTDVLNLESQIHVLNLKSQI